MLLTDQISLRRVEPDVPLEVALANHLRRRLDYLSRMRELEKRIGSERFESEFGDVQRDVAQYETQMREALERRSRIRAGRR